MHLRCFIGRLQFRLAMSISCDPLYVTTVYDDSGQPEAPGPRVS